MATASTSADDVDASIVWETSDSDDAESVEEEDDVFFRAILDSDIESLRLHLGVGGCYSPMSVNSAGCMALHYAVLGSKVDVLKLFMDTINGDEINVFSPDDGMTPLHTSMNGHVATEITEMLCNGGADVNGKNAAGIPVIHYLISLAWSDFEDDFASEQQGIEVRGDSSLLEYPGQSFLIKLRLLYKHGADTNTKDTTSEWLPLHLCCRHFSHRTKRFVDDGLESEWCLHLLQTLLECGADPNKNNYRNQSALWYLAERYYKLKHDRFVVQYTEMTSLLVDNLTDPESRDIFNRTLLHVSCEFSNLVLLDQLLRRRKCLVNVSDCFGLTPLHLVCHNITDDESDLVLRELDLLMQHGANLNCQDDYGSTPLHHCVALENQVVMKYLLDAGAAVDVADADGRSVIDLAIIHRHPNTLKLLGLDTQIKRMNYGASDATIGRVFHLCCHRHYSDNLKWNEIETPSVSLEHYEKWLSNYPICRHNRDLVLQNSMKELETNYKQLQRMTARDAAQAYTEVVHALETAVLALKELDPVFESCVIVGGSNAEFCKVGDMDELDFVFSLPVLSEMVEVYEEELPKSLAGFVRIRPKSAAVFETKNVGYLIDAGGFVKRSAVSKTFHQYLDTVLTRQNVWNESRIFTDEGTIGGNLACANIGQLNIVWYGPNSKRLNISIDIVPALILKDWNVRCLRQNISILNANVVKQHGCFLVMKKFGDDDEDNLDFEGMKAEDGVPIDELFTVSVSQIEHAVLRFSPPSVRNGYKIAKSIQLLCPRLMKPITADEIELHQDLPGNLVELIDHTPMFSPNVYNLIKSYNLKTALLYCLHESNVKIDFTIADLDTKTWNERTIQYLSEEVEFECDIRLSVEWARSIYAKLFEFFRDDILWYHSYFILDRSGDERRLMLDMAMVYCKVMLKHLDSFDSQGRQLIYSRFEH